MRGSKRTATGMRSSLVYTGAAALLLAMIMQSAAAMAQSEYRLGPEDKIRLKVFEWRASQDEVFGWEALNDEYSLGAGGEVSLPLVGSVPAAGATRDELAALISQRLLQRMQLGRPPTVAVEIVEYRPFYIVGPVEKPGAYPYRPGLTLLKALSLAGGLSSSAEGGTRAVISGLGDIDVLLLQRDEAIGKLARFGRNSPAAARSKRLRSSTAGPAKLPLRGSPTGAGYFCRPPGRLQHPDGGVGAAQHQPPDRGSRAGRAPRQPQGADRSLRDEMRQSAPWSPGGGPGMQREVTALEGERLRGETSLLRAQQEVSRAEISIIELRTQHTQNLLGRDPRHPGAARPARSSARHRGKSGRGAQLADPLGGRAGTPRLHRPSRSSDRR